MQSKNDLALRALEVGLGAAFVIAIVVALNSGWLTTGAQKLSDWYAREVNGVLAITVVNTAVTLPQVQRTDLPIPPVETPALSASADEAEPTASPGASPEASLGAS